MAELSPEELTVLSRCPLLRGAEAALTARVAELPGVWAEAFCPGQVIYAPRAFRRCLGVVLSGSVGVSSGRLAMSLLRPGELFGAAALYNSAPEYASTLVCRTPCRVFFLPQETLDALLEEERTVRENYLCYLTGRIRFLSGRLQSLSQNGAAAKLGRYLLAGGKEGSLTCPAADLARRLGVSRASLYRAFDLLEEAELIRRAGKTIEIPDPEALERALREHCE